jgi:hypothetical protein
MELGVYEPGISGGMVACAGVCIVLTILSGIARILLLR